MDQPDEGQGRSVSAVSIASSPVDADLDWYARDLLGRGVRKVHVLAWRDLDDVDAGGSEVHADEFMRRWAKAGLEVLHRTSRAVGVAAQSQRNGYEVVRRGSRYSVFPRTVVAEMTRAMGRYDALVEIWNGVPWLSPVWCRRPHITVLHHVHGPMWGQMLPGPMAIAGRVIEARFAPKLYRNGLTVTPSDATRDELLELGFNPARVVAIPNGVDPVFSLGGIKTANPSLVAVGRLAPVKRFELVIDAAIEARAHVPNLTLTIVGDGPSRSELQGRIANAGATSWITLAGRVSRTELVDRYRSAWLVLSGSLAEGWGLSLTEAAACGTPAVATDIRGHRSSVVDGLTGVLVEPRDLGRNVVRLLLHDAERSRLAGAASERASRLTWDASALGILRCLHSEVSRTEPHSR